MAGLSSRVCCCVISGEVLAVAGVERIRSRDARSTVLLQPLSALSDMLDQTTAAGSPRQPHPLLDGPLLLLRCTVIPHHPHPQSSVLSPHRVPVFPTPCALLRARYCCARPPVILNLRHLLSPQISLCSRWLLSPNTQISNHISRIRGTDAAMKLPKPRALFRSTACPHLACPH